MKKKDLTFGYALIQLFYWMGFATISAYRSAYLLDTGFTSTVIGILMAVTGITATLLQPMVASYADKPDSVSLRVILLVFSVISAVIGGVLFLNGQRTAFLCLLLYWAVFTILQTIQPLVNSLSMACLNKGEKLNFGAARAAGSVGYAFMAWALGQLVAKYDPNLIPEFILGCFVLLAASLLFFPYRKKTEELKNVRQAEKTKSSGNPIAFFKKHKRFAVLLLGMILMYSSHILVNTFTLQIVREKGGGSAEMGTATSFAAMLEIPVMMLFTQILKRVKSCQIVRIAPVFFFLKILGSLLVTNVTGFYLVQLFQIGGWALFCVGSVYYVNDLMGREDAVKGQAYAMATYTAGSVLASLIGGWLIDAASVNAMLLFGTVCAGIGAVIIFFSAEKTKI